MAGLRHHHGCPPFQRPALCCAHAASMQVGLSHFELRALDWLSGALRSGDANRHGLAGALCGRTGWRNSLSLLCLSAARSRLALVRRTAALSAAVRCGLPGTRGAGLPDRSSLVSLVSDGAESGPGSRRPIRTLQGENGAKDTEGPRNPHAIYTNTNAHLTDDQAAIR